MLLDKCLGLSLSDQYWICPADRKTAWSEVNFFENAFSADVGNALFGCPMSGGGVSLMSPDTELVTAWYIMQTRPKPNHISVYHHYLDCCEKRGIPGIRDSLDWMLVLDYLMMNEDRHQNNFGAVRNVGTLEWIGAAPVYDSGTSLWFDKPTMMVGSIGRVASKPFKSSHDEQIKLVSSFGWLNLSALAGLEEELRELIKGSLFIDGARCNALCKALCGRVERLTEVVNSRRNLYPVDDRAADVAEDVAYSGEDMER